ncbi:signal peptide peptidase SppA [Roseibacillus persicicus]|uniref:signal peptide peptidase SppA n=1 Tax=Roseibacillus persicicus TaxID=454148 RepID=UPI00280C8200|nr:signal peptide peptidase SppA [Roseibacillus persicicus]MDQ8192299.1 signal peptide peptidase SppA [Roseibacillus persicicus]
MKKSIFTLCPFLAIIMGSSLFASESTVPIPVFDLTGVITESGAVDAGLLNFDPNPRRPVTHFDVVTSLQEAAGAEEIPAIVVEVDQAGLSIDQLQEIKRGMDSVRAAGKEVWLYSDGLNFKTALLGSAASNFVLNPEGDVSMSGLHSESLYFKGLLDKVGVVIDVVHIGDFKSAGENFYRTAPSAAAEKQSALLLDSLYTTVVTEIAKGRGVTRDSVYDFIDRGVVTARDAKKLGLVDRLQTRTDLVEELQAKFGEEAAFDREYVRKGVKEPEIDGFLDVMKLMFSSGKNKAPKEDYVGVVVFEGAIDFNSIVPARNEVLRLIDDEKCQALVLRVNSPGGSALASEILWEALDEFAQSERPFLVSMGNVAASGGYYISSGSDLIFAEPSTITGSIGVVGMKFAMGEVMEKLGISSHEMKRGEHADLYNTTRPFSKVERQMIRQSMLGVYGTFKKRIVDGRGERIVGDLESLAGGRVYSGADALRIGLVDELGGLTDAIAKAAEMAGMEDPRAIMFPEPKSAFDSLFGSGDEGLGNDHFITLEAGVEPGGAVASWLQKEGLLSLLPADKRDQVQAHLNQLKSLQADRIQLIAPPLPKF